MEQGHVMKGTSGNMPHTTVASVQYQDYSGNNYIKVIAVIIPVRIKAGWIGQVWVSGNIVWESKHAYDEECDAMEKANKYIAKKLAAIFA